jgi:hypothetical protein
VIVDERALVESLHNIDGKVAHNLAQRARVGGRRRLLRRRFLGAAGTAALAVIATVSLMDVTSSPTSTKKVATVVPLAGSVVTRHGFLAQHPADGRIETILTTDSGWRAVAYVDTTGGLCEGWIDPAATHMTGAYSDLPPGRTLTSSGGTDITPPILVEPQAAVTGHTVHAFGLVGRDTHSVDLTNSTGQPLHVVVSSVRTAYGLRAWLATFPDSDLDHHPIDRIFALNGRGSVIGSIRFGQPTGAPPNNGLPNEATPSVP